MARISPSYAAARLYLMLEALCTGATRPGPAELDWATDLLDTLDIPDEVLEEAEADHYKMLDPV